MHTSLQSHSAYSRGYGTASVEELTRQAAALGLGAVALTDLETLAGQIIFHKLCQSCSLKAITGVELRAAIGKKQPFGTKIGRLVLIARDMEGYKNLCQIVSERRKHGPYGAGQPLTYVEPDMRGLVVMTDDTVTAQQLLDKQFDPRSLRLLVVRPSDDHSNEKACLSLAHQSGIKILASTDPVLAASEEFPLHQFSAASHTNTNFAGAATWCESNKRCLVDAATMAHLFSDLPQALIEAAALADSCTLDLNDSPVMVVSKTKEEKTALAVALEKKCRSALTVDDCAYSERLSRELGLINEKNLAEYFLKVATIGDELRRRDIVFTARGSAGGSLVAYLLGLTTCDPIKYGLYFEKFLHKRSKELPDLGLNVASNRRDEILTWLEQTFGKEKLATIGSYQKYDLKTAINNVLKVFAVASTERDLILDLASAQQLQQEILSDELSSALSHCFGTQFELVQNIIKHLIGKPYNISVHPGGFVLADDRIDSYVPLELAPKGVIVTQYDMPSVTETGLPLFDLSADHRLTVIDQTFNLISQKTDPVNESRLEKKNFSERDTKTLAALKAGDTIGCFQLESPDLRAVLKSITINSATDLVTALAIARPGPASGGAKTSFLRRARGVEADNSLHAALDSHFQQTHGLPLFEEDIMIILATLGGISLPQADSLRQKIVVAQNDKPRLAAIRKRFFANAYNHGFGGVEESWQAIVEYADYCLNKAQTTIAAKLDYQAAYLKTHFPLQFACATLNNYGGLYQLRTIAADFCRHNISIMPADINLSGEFCTLETQSILIGLAFVQNLDKQSVARILRERAKSGPFFSLQNLLTRVEFSHKEIEALILSGACDQLPPLSPDNYPFDQQTAVELLEKEVSPEALQSFTNSTIPTADEQVRIYQRLVRAFNELKYLKMHPSAHPIEILRHEANRYDCLPLAKAVDFIGESVKMTALVSVKRSIDTDDTGTIQLLTIEDETGLLQARMGPLAYSSDCDPVDNPGPFLLSGVISEDISECFLQVNELMPFQKRTAPHS